LLSVPVMLHLLLVSICHVFSNAHHLLIPCGPTHSAVILQGLHLPTNVLMREVGFEPTTELFALDHYLHPSSGLLYPFGYFLRYDRGDRTRTCTHGFGDRRSTS